MRQKGLFRSDLHSKYLNSQTSNYNNLIYSWSDLHSKYLNSQTKYRKISRGGSLTYTQNTLTLKRTPCLLSAPLRLTYTQNTLTLKQMVRGRSESARLTYTQNTLTLKLDCFL